MIVRPWWMVAAFLAVGLVVNWLAPGPALYTPVQYLGGAGMLIASVSLMSASLRALRAAGASAGTRRPAAAIATSGPYGSTRNPIYVAMVLGFLGIGMLASAPAVIALSPLLFAALHFGVVLREERYLQHRFGEAYLNYKRAVARWV